MLRVNQLVGLGARQHGGGSGVVKATHWRLRATNIGAADGGSPGAQGWWEYRGNGSDIGIYEAGAHGTGTNIGAGASSVDMYNNLDVESELGGYSGNPWNGGWLHSSTSATAVDWYIRIVFPGAFTIGSLSNKGVASASRQPREMALEYSSDSGSNWTTLATLTNHSKLFHTKWENILGGGTIAAVSA
jgi:hypothetical protein